MKEALPLRLVVVRKLEAAFLDDPSDDLPVLGTLLAMIWGSLRWSDIQGLRLSFIVLERSQMLVLEDEIQCTGHAFRIRAVWSTQQGLGQQIFQAPAMPAC